MALLKTTAFLPVRGGTFSNCAARYDGSKVDRFLAAALMFKSAERITDEVADLLMLLIGPAADWWEVEKLRNSTWDSAIEVMK